MTCHGDRHRSGLDPEQASSHVSTPAEIPARRARHGSANPSINGEPSPIKRNLWLLRQRIATACRRVGRDPDEVRLLPVTKTVEMPRLRQAYAAGLREFAENRVQEARRKVAESSDLDLRWIIIGPLQTNKAKYVGRFASEFQALDRIEVARALDVHLQRMGRSMPVLVQVNSSDERSKYGLPFSEVRGFLGEISAFHSLQVRGLMTLAEFTSDVDRVRACFRRTARLRDRLRQDIPSQVSLQELSMGMSGDFETAIEEGATTIRIGQAIFGPRNLPDSHFWPLD